MPETANCRSCQAPILWVRTEATNSLMPIDAKPDPKGNIVIKDGLAHVMRGDLFEEMLDGPRYVSHFVTCVAQEKHRRKGPKREKD